MYELTNKELRARAWAAVSRYFPQAMLVSFVISLISSGGNNQAADSGIEQVGGAAGAWPSADPVTALLLVGLAAVSILAIGLLMLLLKIFVTDILEVGKNRFYMESRELERSAGVGKLVWAFGSGHYLNIVKIIFFRNIKVVLWTLLLVIPGIYKSYEYAMVPYVLSENPEAESREAFAVSRQLMDGRRFKLFCLEMYFLLFYIPAMVVALFNGLLGIGVSFLTGIFVNPILEAATAEFYASIRRDADGIRLNGFTDKSRPGAGEPRGAENAGGDCQGIG